MGYVDTTHVQTLGQDWVPVLPIHAAVDIGIKGSRISYFGLQILTAWSMAFLRQDYLKYARQIRHIEPLVPFAHGFNL